MVNLVCEAIIPDGPMKEVEEIENSIKTVYRKSIWNKFIKAINDYNLVENGDKIAIGISGGKDSLLLAKLFSELKKDKSRNFEFKAVSLNPGFRQSDLDNFKNNLDKLNIDCEIIDTNIWEIANEKAQDYPCFLCAKMRRGILYKKVEEFGFNKLTLGHHFDDVVETTLMSMFYMGKFETMLPRLKSDNFDIELIRPLFYVEEKSIIKWVRNNGIFPMNCGCTVAAGKTSSKRRETKELLAQLVKNNPDIKKRIIQSTQNVNLEKILGWKTSEGKFSYLNKV